MYMYATYFKPVISSHWFFPITSRPFNTGLLRRCMTPSSWAPGAGPRAVCSPGLSHTPSSRGMVGRRPAAPPRQCPQQTELGVSAPVDLEAWMVMGVSWGPVTEPRIGGHWPYGWWSTQLVHVGRQRGARLLVGRALIRLSTRGLAPQHSNGRVAGRLPAANNAQKEDLVFYEYSYSCEGSWNKLSAKCWQPGPITKDLYVDVDLCYNNKHCRTSRNGLPIA